MLGGLLFAASAQPLPLPAFRPDSVDLIIVLDGMEKHGLEDRASIRVPSAPSLFLGRLLAPCDGPHHLPPRFRGVVVEEYRRLGFGGAHLLPRDPPYETMICGRGGEEPG